jgi:threonine dehydratase
VEIAASETLADGLRATCPGELTFPIVQQFAEDILLVSEDEIRAAVKFLLTRMKLLVEPSGAVPAAAALFGKLPASVRSAGIILSGGNVDFETLATL